MKHLKNFENSTEDNVELLRQLLEENPLHTTHDFYMFIGGSHYVEAEGGLYKKILDIENMVRITPDEQSLSASSGLNLRARFQQDSSLYHIWLPIELRDEVEGKGSNSIDRWLVDLIDKHKNSGADEHGKQVYKDVLQRAEDIKKYNL